MENELSVKVAPQYLPVRGRKWNLARPRSAQRSITSPPDDIDYPAFYASSSEGYEARLDQFAIQQLLIEILRAAFQ